MSMLIMAETPVDAPEARLLMGELSRELVRITGADGRTRFHPADAQEEGGVFLVAYLDGEPWGCGALRRLSADTGEIKRVYARPNRAGVGSGILAALEERAAALGYRRLLLETRRQNTRAMAFYLRHGYAICKAYGPYVGREDACCFEKRLRATCGG
ncbi:MAG: GNAT family N-acetyltransferase [Aristaeellaceae bacterium]